MRERLDSDTEACDVAWLGMGTSFGSIVSFVGFNVVYILTRLMQCVNRFSCVSAWGVDSWCGGGVVRIRGW